jgi:hypothetical protein
MYILTWIHTLYYSLSALFAPGGEIILPVPESLYVNEAPYVHSLLRGLATVS